MGRLFTALFCLMLLSALCFACPAEREPAQAAFFSMIFPQLMPDFAQEREAAATPDEAPEEETALGEAVLL